ncbi:TetR/AcrR family transcriptional regulator [Flavobacterium arcticum]|uniref:TetR/AcrR family transcriptional regulator n=1 Tax=Flavobacterium arcticum TaxID=1784713 RepID=A0A345HEA4_9FLAO|nr:TetR/AcrR family transcriptional regulator [Flavobacterium arcticum]AXG74914.1 TetR/AcrR family transcriptional regulator [Flavobacterium arcticum]KAF2509588.1 TetR/AcrR family transcriptional regulator [Flavobacterium arcticum]
MEQKLKSELTKQIIIDKSFMLFYENGFKPTSILAIMKATNLTKGAFYHHFEDKRQVGITVISQKLQERVYNAMITPLHNSGNAAKILEDTFHRRIKSFSLLEKKHGCPLNNLINEIGDTEKAYQLALRKIIDEWKTAIINLIERGKKEGSIRESINSTATATYLISAFEGIRGLRKLYDNDTILDEYLLGLNFYIKQISI